MLNKIWMIMMVVGIVFGVFNGRTMEMSEGVLQSVKQAIELSVSLCAGYMFWNGIINIIDKAGGIKSLSKLLMPVLKKLFPDNAKDDETMGYATTNIAANILGLGNAATPAGLNAIKRMGEKCENGIASDDVSMFMVLNTCMIQILPTTIISMRQAAGAENPAMVLPVILLSSVVSLVVGVGSALYFRKRGKK